MSTITNPTIYNREVYTVNVEDTGIGAGTYDIDIKHNAFDITKGFSLIITNLVNATVTLLAENKPGNELDLTECLFNVTELDTSEPWITDISLPISKLKIRVTCTGGSEVTLDFFAPRS